VEKNNKYLYALKVEINYNQIIFNTLFLSSNGKMKLYIFPQIFALCTVYTSVIFAQNIEVNKIEPPNWWSGMKYNIVQCMLYGNNLNNLSPVEDLSDLKKAKVYEAHSSSYSFIEVEIPATNRDTIYAITLTNSVDTVSIKIPVLQRSNCQDCYKGFNSQDVIYLITPDRFSNGDITNDELPGFVNDYAFKSEMGRHGGDIQGIINHLDYIKETGFTAIWINPLLENNSKMSYHGYAATDLYKIDERFGTNDLYKKLVYMAHQKGLKIIFDHINNHIGINHIWINDPPFDDWFNGSKEKHFITPHEKISVYSTYSSELTRDSTIQGWFVEEMPDLNQRNPFLAKYLIQNMLWWIEYSGLDGIREDTYPYSDQKFLSEWNATILKEYTDLNITGEAWIEDPAFLSQYQKDSKLNTENNTNLPSVIDFGMYRAIRNFSEPSGSVNDLYETLAKDFLYNDPNNLLTFADNHDIERIMYYSNKNIKKFKLALTFLLTTRGIPQIYYGTEIGIVGGGSHGELREEFPGGFPEHLRNAFNQNQRLDIEKEIYQFIKSLFELRKRYKSLSIGGLVHFPPEDELYFYFRILDNEKILVAINNDGQNRLLNKKLFSHLINSKTVNYKILFGADEVSINEDNIMIKPKSSTIILIK
jgi:glycosidase